MIVESENINLGANFIQSFLQAYQRYKKRSKCNVISLGAVEHDELWGYYDSQKKLVDSSFGYC